MIGSRFDQVVESYVKSILSDEEKRNPSSVSRISAAIKTDILSDLRSEEIRKMKSEVEQEAERCREKAAAEAKDYKKKLIKKAKRNLIYETIFVAFLVGIVVNQATSLIPEGKLAACVIIIIALLVCILLIWAETGKD